MPGPVAIGGSVDLTFTGIASVASNSTITLSGSVADGTPPDPDASNDTATFDTTVTAGSDVSITKSRAPSGSLIVGDTVTFTLDPRFSGDTPFGLTLIDSLPGTYQIVSVSPAAGWSCGVAGQVVTCTRASGPAPGFNVGLGQITIVANVISAGAAVNAASISASGPFDPDLSNNTGDDGGVVIVPPSIDLAVRKSAPQPPLVVIGNSYDFRLGASNLGNVGFTGTVRVQDLVPAGLDVTAVGGPGWSCSPAPPLSGPATITCDILYTAASPLPRAGRRPTSS